MGLFLSGAMIRRGATLPRRWLASLWQGILHGLGENRCSTPVGFVARAAWVLERFTWCLPAASRGAADVSFFDHAKVTAALAGVRVSPNLRLVAPFLLVAGELVGIQSICSICDREPAGWHGDSGPARSKWQLTSRWSPWTLPRRLGLPLTQRIFCRGAVCAHPAQHAGSRNEEFRRFARRWPAGFSTSPRGSIDLAGHPASYCRGVTILPPHLPSWVISSGMLGGVRGPMSFFLGGLVRIGLLPPAIERPRTRSAANLPATNGQPRRSSPRELAVCSHCREEEQLGWQWLRHSYDLISRRSPWAF